LGRNLDPNEEGDPIKFHQRFQMDLKIVGQEGFLKKKFKL
jgi:hypothetical protein